MNLFFKKIISNDSIYATVTLTILFYIFRPAIPLFKYPFILTFSFLILVSFYKSRDQIFSTIKTFIINYLLVFCLFTILFISFIFSDKLYLIILKDIANGLILISIFYLMSLNIKTGKEFDRFLKLFLFIIIIFSVIISVNELLVLFNIVPAIENSLIFEINGLSKNAILEVDNNFGILPVLLGSIMAFYYFLNTKSSISRIICLFLMLFFWVSIFFSGSRRALFILCLFFIMLVLIQLSRILVNHLYIKKIGSKSLVLLSSIIFLMAIAWALVSLTSYSFKNRILENIGSKNLLYTKSKIALVVLKYNLLINKSSQHSDIYNTLWTPVFNPYDPESSWGTKNHKNIFPLSGNNVEIVPAKAHGYLLDSTCISSPAETYIDAPSLIAKLKVNNGDRIKAYVYCFVSNEFSGDLVRLSIGTDYIYDQSVKGKSVDYYDLNDKGSWRKLYIDVECRSGEIPIYLSIVKNDAKDFSKLKGYVIFAYPNYELLTNTEKKAPEVSYIQNSEKFVDSSAFSFITHGYYTMNLLSGFGILDNTKPKVDRDPIRIWISTIVNEDTTYHKYKNSLSVDSKWDVYGDDRLARWVFAIKIYSKEFSPTQKLFGGGFNFLNWYGYYFLKDKTASDWPHNPFLSILLYSGILGLLIYCFFIYKVFYYYLKYRREYPLLFIFFLITFFFTFFSGGSPFDPPIMGFFVILPFFIHSVHKRDASLSENSTNTDE